MNNTVRVILADQYDLVVGDTFQLYYRGVIESPNPYCYSIIATCEKGSNYPRYFEYTPEFSGQHKLTISVYNAARELLGRGETLLNVVEAKSTQKNINILCIGASGTANGYWVSEAHRRLTKVDGEPQGIGCPNIHFVGNCRRTEAGRNEVGFEAFGGWTWSSFTSEAVYSILVKSPNTRTQEDQHSLWKDENGAIWQLETIQSDYLKFNPYKNHTLPRPESGFLTHFQNAVNTNPIPILSSFTEKPSPFFDQQTQKLDFKTYTERSNIDTIDAVYILLGVNGLLRPQATNSTTEEYCKYVVSEGKVLVDALKRDFPNVKVKILAPFLASMNGGTGFNYGANMIYANLYDFTHYIMELNLAYQAWANEDDYKDFLELISVTGQFDAENNYPYIQKTVNTRSKTTERFDTNGLHPLPEGYFQVADAVYRNIVKEFCSE